MAPGVQSKDGCTRLKTSVLLLLVIPSQQLLPWMFLQQYRIVQVRFLRSTLSLENQSHPRPVLHSKNRCRVWAQAANSFIFVTRRTRAVAHQFESCRLQSTRLSRACPELPVSTSAGVFLFLVRCGRPRFPFLAAFQLAHLQHPFEQSRVSFVLKSSFSGI